MKLTRMLFTALMALFYVFPAPYAMAEGGDPPPPPFTGGEPFYIRVFLQGFYIGEHEMRKAQDWVDGSFVDRWTNNVADRVVVEIHEAGRYGDPATSFTIDEEISLNTNGWMNVNMPVEGEYYITVKTRNHIETVSANTINFATADPREYDFTTAANKAYGNNQVELEPGIYGIYAGDVTQSRTMVGADRAAVNLAIFQGKQGYVNEDFRGTGTVVGAHRAAVNLGIFNGVEAHLPD